MSRWIAGAAIVAMVAAIGAGAQEERKDQDKSTTERMPTFQPGKEHQLLKQFDGDWEFKAKCQMPGMEPMEGQGTESSRLTLGGFWLETEDKGMMKNKDWNGKGFMGWDPARKKYMGVWVDSNAPFMAHFEGDADSSGKVFTFRFSMMDEKRHGMAPSSKDAESGRKDTGKDYDKDLGKDPGKDLGKEPGKDFGKEPGTDLGRTKDMGKGMKCPERMVHEIKDQDHRTLKFYGKDDSGKESLWTEITYTRKPAMIK